MSSLKLILILVLWGSVLSGCTNISIQSNDYYEGTLVDIHYIDGLSCIESQTSLLYVREHVFLEDWAWSIYVDFEKGIVKLVNYEKTNPSLFSYSLVKREIKI